MAWPEKVVPGQQFDRWGDKLRTWQQYVEDNWGLLNFDDLFVPGDATVKGDLHVERIIFGVLEGTIKSTEADDFWVLKDLKVQDDATIKDDLIVEGRIIGKSLGVTLDPLYDDATIKHDLLVEGDSEVQDLVIRKDLTIYGDATVRQNVWVGGITTIGDGLQTIPLYVIGRININEGGAGVTRFLDVNDAGTTILGLGRTSIGNTAVFYAPSGLELATPNAKLFGDLLIQDDATAKGDLIVEKDLYVGNDLLVKRDATVDDNLFVDIIHSNDLYVENIYLNERLYDQHRSDTYLIFDENGEVFIVSVAGTILARFKGDSRTVEFLGNKVFFSENYHIFKEDATIHDNLRVMGTINANIIDVSNYLTDTTIKNNLYIEGGIFIDGQPLTTSEAQDFHIWKDLIVQDDATVKGSLRVDGPFEVDDFTVRKDLIVHDDATIKGDLHIDHTIEWDLGDLFVRNDGTVKGHLYVDGIIHGQLGSIAADFRVKNDLIVKDDATVEDTLYVLSGRVIGIEHDRLENINADQHRSLDDDSTTLSNLWSARKIYEEIGRISIPGVLTEFYNDVTPNVSGSNVVRTDSTVQIIITNFLGGSIGILTIIFTDDLTTIQHNTNIKLQGAEDFFGNSNDVIQLIFDGSKWYETGRSLNS